MTVHSWPDSPAIAAPRAVGARVAKPERPGWCWGVVTHIYGTRLLKPKACSLRAQSKRCTCRSHRKLEQEAQALKAQIEAQGSEAAQ